MKDTPPDDRMKRFFCPKSGKDEWANWGPRSAGAKAGKPMTDQWIEAECCICHKKMGLPKHPLDNTPATCYECGEKIRMREEMRR